MSPDKPLRCKARQTSDQMTCVCGLAWDMNDPDPPDCPKHQLANKTLEDCRQILKPAVLLNRTRLLSLQEVDLGQLPAFGLPEKLVTISWRSLPDAAYATIRPNATHDGKVYTFFTVTGEMLMEADVRESFDGRRVSVRADGGGEWQQL